MNKESTFRINWRESEKAKEKPHIKLLLNAMKNNFNPPKKDVNDEETSSLPVSKTDNLNAKGNGALMCNVSKVESCVTRGEENLEEGDAEGPPHLTPAVEEQTSLMSSNASGVSEDKEDLSLCKNSLNEQSIEGLTSCGSILSESQPSSIQLSDLSGSEGVKVKTFSKRRASRHRSSINTQPEYEPGSPTNFRKRSARRWSKEGESVLQNAIARKEKSLSSIGHSDDEKALKSAVVKSLRENKSSLPARKYASNRIQEKNCPPLEHISDMKWKNNTSKSPLSINCDTAKVEPAAESPSVKSECSSKQSSGKGEGDFVSYHYTKTGKRRYKPFRGFRYSFTSRTKRAKVMHRPGPQERSNANDRHVKIRSSNSVYPSKTKVKEAGPVALIENARLSNSSGTADACTSKAKKPCRADSFTSNSVDTLASASKQEPPSISYKASTPNICLCQLKTNYFVSKSSEDADELLCQAIDSIEGRLIGCCYAVEGSECIRFYRASCRVPYNILCEQHRQRLLRHICCPGCGHFCTQGRFVQCASYHYYHRDCQLMNGDTAQCPHCGIESPPDEVTLSLGQHKHPVFLPQQKFVKKQPSARITVGSTPCEEEPPKSPPLSFELAFPSAAHVLDKGEREKLEQFLNGASSVRSEGRTAHLQRYTTKHLYQAAKAGDAEKIILILRYGISPSHIFREISMRSALHAAASMGHVLVVHILVQAGAQLDPQDSDLMTPVMLAATNGHTRIVQYLVKAGASVTLQGADGMTVLHIAAKAGDLKSCHYVLSCRRIPWNFINMKDDGGWTPLIWSSEFCHFEITRYLLENKADPLLRDEEENIALHWAAFSGSEDVSESLLNYGSDVDCLNVHGDSPLHVAARQNNLACVILFLARGAKSDFVNRAGQQAIDCAKEGGDSFHVLRTTSELRKSVTNCRERTNRILCNDVTRGKEPFEIQCLNAVDEESEPRNYVYVTENCFTSNIPVDRTVTSMQSCECEDSCENATCNCTQLSLQSWYDSDGKLLPDFNFFDPPMLFECNVLCTCNTNLCKNRVVQRGLKLRFQLFRTIGKGWGVRTLTLIPKGTYVCEYIGEIISDCEADLREDDSYLFDLDNRDGETYCIDACRYGNIARFINHMCAPNLRPIRVFIGHHDLHFPRIAFFANRDIMAQEELGFDYGDKFWIIKCKSFFCTCGAPECKYSETTIQKTLAEYKRKQALECGS